MVGRVRRRTTRGRIEEGPTEAQRREWTLDGIRLYGFRLFPDGDPRRMAWSVAWRRWEAHLGPFPALDTDLIEAAIEEWPSKALYRLVIESWQPPRGLRPYHVFDVWTQPTGRAS